MLQITQRRQEGTLIAVYTGELDHHAARAAIEQTEDLLRAQVQYRCRTTARPELSINVSSDRSSTSFSHGNSTSRSSVCSIAARAA